MVVDQGTLYASLLMNEVRRAVCCHAAWPRPGHARARQAQAAMACVSTQADVHGVPPYPRDIMSWTEEQVYAPVFNDALRVQVSAVRVRERVDPARMSQLRKPNVPCLLLPRFAAVVQAARPRLCVGRQENRRQRAGYELSEQRALPPPPHARWHGPRVTTVRDCVPLWPAITRDRWLHHTSFLWDFNPANMEYLLIPESQPE